MHTKDTYIAHPLRDIILHFDRSVQAPAFETEALEYYVEMHDRTWATLQRVRQARIAAMPYILEIDDLEFLYNEAFSKFDHLKVMIPENPEKPRIREQLRTAIARIEEKADDLVPRLIHELRAWYDYYEDYIVEEERWLEEDAFPRFDKVFADYESCSVDMMALDTDLDDFKGTLGFLRSQQYKYYDELDGLEERYTELNDKIQDLIRQVSEFDADLV